MDPLTTESADHSGATPNTFNSAYDVDVDVDVDMDEGAYDYVVNDEQSESGESLESATTNGGASQTASNSSLAVRETEQVCWLRGFLLIVLLLATFLMAIAIFFSTRKSELDQFETQYVDHVSKIFDSFQVHLKDAIVASDNLAAALTTHGKNYRYVPNAVPRNTDNVTATTTTGTYNVWPYLDLPDFHIRASGTLNVASTSFVGYAPLVNQTQRQDWEAFSVASQDWVRIGLKHENETLISPEGIPERIYRLDTQGNAVPVDSNDGSPYFPIWQHFPVQENSVNFNIVSHSEYQLESQVAIHLETIVLGLISEPREGNQIMGAEEDPFSHIYFPVFSDFVDSSDRQMVALLVSTVDWTRYLQTANLSPTANGIQCILTNGCGQAYTYEVQDGTIVFLAEGDAHNTEYDSMEQALNAWEHLQQDSFLSYGNLHFNTEFCPFTLHVFPSEATEMAYYTKRPAVYTVVVILVFLFTSLTFFSYDYLVERRQKVVLKTAVKNYQIVSSLFPETVRNRLFGENNDHHSAAATSRPPTDKMRIKFFVDTNAQGSAENETKMDAPPRRQGAGKGVIVNGAKPIADLFPNTTVLFGDVAGFTAWSSAREPAQVFVLLETLYAAFDKVASKRKVFKVETIGDCYVAVTGVPVAQENHALIMVRFAQDCLRKMEEVTIELATTLGPDTADLALRIGLHSGPVTAGVLRGQKSRFQLFGDTVNTASRMESTGKPKQIQCSQNTAELLIEAGKGHWVEPRQDAVFAKGIGDVQTYFVCTRLGGSHYEGSATCRSSVSSDNASVVSSLADDFEGEDGMERLENLINMNGMLSMVPAPRITEHVQRLIDWNNDILSRQLKVIMARRMSSSSEKKTTHIASFINNDVTSGENPRDEYAKSIALPRFDPNSINAADPEQIELKEIVQEQLLDLITSIAKSYHNNPFHNFEHATHVTMSVNKILKRIVAADDFEVKVGQSKDQLHSHLHDFTFGITSDPLTHFACIFSAMIHDMDHPGVTNTQLVAEKDARAELYVNKSVAEQNSVDLAWELLMDVAYAELRACLFETEEDMKRFRQLVVNSVMATDIFDPDLKALRNDRWDKAFHPPEDPEYLHLPEEDVKNLKGTIVIEHIIQASDVAHTMQHWHVYQKWNRRLFEEMYKAHKAGRSPKDPSEGWYKGELWFYDNYIIPLAKKLKECGVFGVASDEFLNYARHNRREWEAKGQGIVQDMQQRLSSGKSLD